MAVPSGPRLQSDTETSHCDSKVNGNSVPASVAERIRASVRHLAAAFRAARSSSALRWLSSLVVWLLVILAGGGLATSHLSLRGCDRSAAEQEDDGQRPMWIDIVRYSSTFVAAVEHANREQRDFLSNYTEFCAIWNGVSPSKPMMVKLVSHGTIDPRSKQLAWARDGHSEAIDFEEFLDAAPFARRDP